MPGIRLNFSTSGVSTSIGGRGGSISIGSRGAYANVGLPGTGISSRTRIDGGGSSRSSSRSAYRDLRVQAEAAEKARQLDHAQSEVDEFNERVERLTSVLKKREKEVFDWDGLVSADVGYASRDFAPSVFDKKAIKKTLNKISGVLFWRWGIGIAALLMISPGLIGFGGFCFAVAAVMLIHAHIGRASLLKSKKKSHEAIIADAHKQHDAKEALRRRWAEMAPQLREAQRTENAEPLLEILSEELANEDLPIPLVFDIEFDGIRGAVIELILPEADELPIERLSLTARGKASRKPMTQRDRREIFGSLCCGLALRVAHETFRVIPSLVSIEIVGQAEVNDPATGHDREITPLRFKVTRMQFETLDLDDVSPEAALEGLGGKFACTAKLELRDTDK